MTWLRRALLFLAIAAASNAAAVAALPWVINAYVLHKMEQLAGGTNRALPAPRATAQSRTVVRPSPDLLYTVCVYDVSEHPLHITAPVQDSYVSVAGFAADTSNFFALNDSSVVADAQGKKRLDVVITAGHGAVPAGATVVQAPGTRGLILFRSLIPSDGELPALRGYQAQQRCQAIES